MFNADPRALAGTAIGMVLFATILSTTTWDVEQNETYISYQPYTYEYSLVRTQQTRPFPWLHEVTQAQYKLRNEDAQEGQFILNVTFDNGVQSGTTTKKANILAGEGIIVTINSPLSGKSAPILNVIPPNKAVPMQRTVTKKVHIWDYWFLFR